MLHTFRKKFLSRKYESLRLYVRLFLYIVDLIGMVLFAPAALIRCLLNRPFDPRLVKKILIIRLDGLGDLVMSTAALREIRSGFPAAEITLVIGPWSQGIAPCIPYYDHLIVYPSFLFGIYRGKRRLDLAGAWKFIWRLRKSHFDLGIDLRGDILSIIPLYLSGAHYRFGRDRWGGRFLLTHPVETNRIISRHEKDKTLAPLRDLGIPVKNQDTSLVVPSEDEAFIRQFLRERHVNPNDRIASVAPMALYSWRAWPPEKFAGLISRLAHDSYRIFLLGGPEDREAIERIKDLSGIKAMNVAGLLTLCQTAALLHFSSVFIGNDSGLSHIAAALQVPLIQLFGPGEPEKFGYFGLQQRVIMKTHCPHYPCVQYTCRNKMDWCMDRIAVEDVLFGLSELSIETFQEKILRQKQMKA